MALISMTAEAGLEVIRGLASGEFELAGIQVREAASKHFRYLLRGFENLPAEPERLGDLPPLQALEEAIGMTQVLQTIAIAQNAAIAQTLRRIEARMEAIERRLDGIEARLNRIETKQSLILQALRTAPVSRLKAAASAALVARQHHDKTALINAGQNAQQAFHDLLNQAQHLVRLEEDGLPIAVLVPVELADLAESAAEAASVASAIWLSLDNKMVAERIMRETANTLEAMRGALASALGDPERMLRRVKMDEGHDTELIAAGARLKEAMLWSRGRQVLIEQGVIRADPDWIELEHAIPANGIGFIPIIDAQPDAIPRGEWRTPRGLNISEVDAGIPAG